LNPSNDTIKADLFCRVIDNLGDVGVMWRLARQLSVEKQWQIRLWVDQLEPLAKIEPLVDCTQKWQQCRGVQIGLWPGPEHPIAPNPVVIAGFSCDLPEAYLKRLASMDNPLWVQLEYLSAQDWVASFHGQRSQRNDQLRPVFFFPGFTDQTGGLLREHDLAERQIGWQDAPSKAAWLASLGVTTQANARLVSVFTYEDAPVSELIQQMQSVNAHFHLLLPKGQKPPKLTGARNVTWQHIDFLSQDDYDRLLCTCDLNLVRGEDSWVRAIWAARPMIWQAYRQPDGAHHPKIDAWVDLAQLPAPLGLALHEWADGELKCDLSALLQPPGWHDWCDCASRLAKRLQSQTDLASRLDQWCRANGA
jgi:uncharacterized repeat protein (TIGR03837 family)